VKPTGRRYQTATRVKVLSPVIFNVKEVDSFHLLEDSMICLDKVRDRLLFRGLRPWYEIAWKLQELGRSCKLCNLVKRGTPPEADNTHSVAGEKVGWHDRRGRKSNGLQEVGLTHSRGVTGVMPCESVFMTDTRRG
jgi:hypothetical protein